MKELSLEIILGNENCQIYCWNLNRLCTSRDYNCGLSDATAVSCQIQWHWLCLLCYWHLLAFSTWFFIIHDNQHHGHAHFWSEGWAL